MRKLTNGLIYILINKRCTHSSKAPSGNGLPPQIRVMSHHCCGSPALRLCGSAALAGSTCSVHPQSQWFAAVVSAASSARCDLKGALSAAVFLGSDSEAGCRFGLTIRRSNPYTTGNCSPLFEEATEDECDASAAAGALARACD